MRTPITRKGTGHAFQSARERAGPEIFGALEPGVSLEKATNGASGYSSLTYLRLLPVDLLKIDRSFVAGVGNVMEDTTFMRALRRLAKTLNLRTVVEGVETPSELASLQRIGFQMAQGFLFARPMPLEDLQHHTAEDATFPGQWHEPRKRTA